MLTVASALDVVIVTAQPLCKSDPDTRQGDATRPQGHWDGQCHPRQPGPCDSGAPCTADGVQLQRGRGARVLNCSELPRRPRATRRRPDSGSFLDGCVRHPGILAGLMFSLTVTPSLTTWPFLLKELTPVPCKKKLFSEAYSSSKYLFKYPRPGVVLSSGCRSG